MSVAVKPMYDENGDPFIPSTYSNQVIDPDTKEPVNEQISALNENLNNFVKVVDGKFYVYDTTTSTWKEVSMGMPTLDYGNPLYTFSNTNLSYTATTECYLIGQLIPNSSTNTLIINGTQVLRGNTSNNAQVQLKLVAGDVVTINNYGTATTDVGLHVFGLKS